jgi:hypothetical protein
MTTPTWSDQPNVKDLDFYTKPTYDCPKCRTALTHEMSELMLLASDVLADRCSICGVYIVLNLLHGRVVIEGFLTRPELDSRLTELAQEFKSSTE